MSSRASQTTTPHSSTSTILTPTTPTSDSHLGSAPLREGADKSRKPGPEQRLHPPSSSSSSAAACSHRRALSVNVNNPAQTPSDHQTSLHTETRSPTRPATSPNTAPSLSAANSTTPTAQSRESSYFSLPRSSYVSPITPRLQGQYGRRGSSRCCLNATCACLLARVAHH